MGNVRVWWRTAMIVNVGVWWRILVFVSGLWSFMMGMLVFGGECVLCWGKRLTWHHFTCILMLPNIFSRLKCLFLRASRGDSICCIVIVSYCKPCFWAKSPYSKINKWNISDFCLQPSHLLSRFARSSLISSEFFCFVACEQNGWWNHYLGTQGENWWMARTSDWHKRQYWDSGASDVRNIRCVC